MLLPLLMNLDMFTAGAAPPAVEPEEDKGKDAGSGQMEPPWWAQTVPVPGTTPRQKEPERALRERPRVKPKAHVATVFDELQAQSDALRAEVQLTRPETRWITERIRTLGEAVATASQIAEQRRVERRLTAFGERLATLQNEAIRRERERLAIIRRDDEDFLALLLRLVE